MTLVRSALLVLLMLAVAGCAGRPILCREGTPAEGETGVCFVSGEWVLRGGTRGEEGPVVVLVHGANEDRKAFDGLSRALAENGSRVLSFDLRAHGESTRGGERGDPGKFTTAEWKAMVNDLRKAEAFTRREWGAKPDVLVGANVGSSLALLYAVENGTGSVVMLSPGLRYKGVEIETAASGFRGRALVIASAQNAPGAETTAQMRDRMTRAASVDTMTVAGTTVGTGLLTDPLVVERIVRFAS